MPPLFVTFFTPRYAAEADGLRQTLDAFALPHLLQPVADLGSWQLNTQAKSRFVLGVLESHPGKPIVWLDADARVRKYPALFDPPPGCDFAAHWLDNGSCKPWELLSGTLYFSGSDASIALAGDWANECEKSPDDYDQLCLDRCVQRAKAAGLKVLYLPPSYTQIFDLMAQHGEPVIEHLQASRRLKT